MEKVSNGESDVASNKIFEQLFKYFLRWLQDLWKILQDFYSQKMKERIVLVM